MAKIGDGWAPNTWNTLSWAEGAWALTPGTPPSPVVSTGDEIRTHSLAFAGFPHR